MPSSRQFHLLQHVKVDVGSRKPPLTFGGQHHQRTIIAFGAFDPPPRAAPLDGVVHRYAFALGPFDKLRHRQLAIGRGELPCGADFRQASRNKPAGAFADDQLLLLGLCNLEETLCRRLIRGRSNLRLVDLGELDDSAECDRAALLHRLPDGVGGFVQQDFVGHG